MPVWGLAPGMELKPLEPRIVIGHPPWKLDANKVPSAHKPARAANMFSDLHARLGIGARHGTKATRTAHCHRPSALEIGRKQSAIGTQTGSCCKFVIGYDEKCIVRSGNPAGPDRFASSSEN